MRLQYVHIVSLLLHAIREYGVYYLYDCFAQLALVLIYNLLHFSTVLSITSLFTFCCYSLIHDLQSQSP